MEKFNEEVCVVCGAPVPEGRQICPNCEEKYFGNKKYRPSSKMTSICLFTLKYNVLKKNSLLKRGEEHS